MKKFNFNFMVGMFLSALAFILGASGDVAMATAMNVEGGGDTQSGSAVGTGSSASAGVATESYGRGKDSDGNYNADPDFYLNDIDKQIVKIRPMSTPIDQISRYATNRKVDSFICKYYSVGTRPIETTTLSGMSTATGDQFELKVADPSIFTMDDTIRVVGTKATWNNVKGQLYSATHTGVKSKQIPDLMLVVIGRANSGNPLVYAVNAGTSSGQTKAITLGADLTVIRMGKACGELDVQTGRFANLPKADEQYCQHFAIQVEQSTFDKIAAKEVNWDMSDLEEDALYDMRLTQEMSYLFGDMAQLTHSAKDGMLQWFTKGVWWQAGQDVKIGHWDSTKNKAVISDEDLIDMSKAVFVGTGTGNKKKVLICGSDVVAAFGKIQSDKFRLVSTYERWHLKFTEWETGFGTLYIIHDEMFDTVGMSANAFCLDPEYLYKATHLSHERSILDLKSAGIRNTDATVLREVSALYLRYPMAHARMALATATVATQSDD